MPGHTQRLSRVDPGELAGRVGGAEGAIVVGRVGVVEVVGGGVAEDGEEDEVLGDRLVEDCNGRARAEKGGRGGGESQKGIWAISMA